MLPPCPPAFVEHQAPQPVFRPYRELATEERRVLDASGGEAKYDELAKQHPRWLASFLNQAAALEARKFADGRTAWSFVTKAEGFAFDRCWLAVDPELHARVARDATWLPGAKGSFVGPEDSSFFHHDYGQCFRERVVGAGQQLAFHPASGYRKLEVDIDEECPTGGSATMAWGHVWRVAVTHLTPAHASPMESDAYEIYRLLGRRGIKPHYDIKFD